MITRDGLGEQREIAVRAKLREIAASVLAALQAGAAALDAAEHAVALLEDSEFFNAGTGSVLNRDGRVETDAAVMEGATGRVGAVAAVSGIRNPVHVARLVLERSEHIFLAGEGAREFARAQGVPEVAGDELVTEERRRQLERARGADRVSLDHDEYYGTVGAVVRDAEGHLAAATSTGGMTNKHPGRVGDSPVIGAGTWASDDTCAVSATGHGECLLRAAVAHDVHARVRYAGQSMAAACEAALAAVRELGGNGGLIAVDREGNLALPFNTQGMYRAWVDADGEPRVAIWEEESKEKR